MEDHTKYTGHEFSGTKTGLKACLGRVLSWPECGEHHFLGGRSSGRVRAGEGEGQLCLVMSQPGSTPHNPRFSNKISLVSGECSCSMLISWLSQTSSAPKQTILTRVREERTAALLEYTQLG